MSAIRFPIAVAVLLVASTLSLAQQPKFKSPPPTLTPPPTPPASMQDAQGERISPVMLLDRIAQLEASNRGIGQRIDDSRNLTYALFGGLVALLAAIGVPIIFRERRELREFRELGNHEREKTKLQLAEARTDIESQIAIVRGQLNSETETLRKGLVDSLRAQMLALQQQFELAVSAQKTELIETAPPEVAKQAIARVEAQLQTYAEALRGLNAQPNPLDHVLRANFYLSQGGEQNDLAAAQEARRALELDQENVDALVALSKALLRRGQGEEAWSHLIHASELAPTKTSIVNEIVATGLRLHRFEDVLRWSRVLEQQDVAGNRAWLAMAQATALNQLGQKREAIQVLSDVLSEQPQLSQIRAHLAKTFLDAEMFADADRVATEGLALNPTDHQMPVLRARARFGGGRHVEALEDLATAERENPRDVNIFITKARILNTLQDHDGAVAACEKGLALRAPEGMRALLFLNYAEALLRLSRVADAVKAAEQAVKLGPAFVTNHLVLVECLFCADRLPEALLTANEAANLSESSGGTAMLRFFAALCAYGAHGRSAKAEEAEEAFRAAAAGHDLTWDFAFIRRCIEARADSEDVRERMLQLVEWAAGPRAS